MIYHILFKIDSNIFSCYNRLAARIDGLANLTGNLADAVFARFVRSGDTRAFARTLSLRVPRKAMGQLRELYDEVVWETLRRLDAEARELDDADVERIALSILWSPHEFLRGILQHELAAERATNEDASKG